MLNNDTDVDGDPLTATIVAQPQNGAVNLSTDGGFTYTPNLNFNGLDEFTYTASDGTAASGAATVSITVTGVNDAPVANNDAQYGTDEDTALTVAGPGVLANDTDVDGDPLTAAIVAQPQNGAVALDPDNAGGFTYTPNLNFNGLDKFTYTASDGTAARGAATVSYTHLTLPTICSV